MRRICGIFNDILKTGNVTLGLPPKLGFGVYADDEHQILRVCMEDLKNKRDTYTEIVPGDILPEKYIFVYDADITQSYTSAMFKVSKGDLEYHVVLYPKVTGYLSYAELHFSKKANFNVSEKIPTIPSNFHGLRIIWFRYFLTNLYEQYPSIKMNYKNVETPFANSAYNLTDMFDAVRGEVDLSHWRIHSTNKTKVYIHNFGLIQSNAIFYLPIFEGKTAINIVETTSFIVTNSASYCIFVGKQTSILWDMAVKCNMYLLCTCSTLSEAREQAKIEQRQIINSQLLGTYDKRRKSFIILYKEEG